MPTAEKVGKCSLPFILPNDCINIFNFPFAPSFELLKQQLSRWMLTVIKRKENPRCASLVEWQLRESMPFDRIYMYNHISTRIFITAYFCFMVYYTWLWNECLSHICVWAMIKKLLFWERPITEYMVLNLVKSVLTFK